MEIQSPLRRKDPSRYETLQQCRDRLDPLGARRVPEMVGQNHACFRREPPGISGATEPLRDAVGFPLDKVKEA